MVKYFKTVSTSIESSIYEQFRKICKDRKCTPHTILKDYIFDLVEQDGEKENVGIREESSGSTDEDKGKHGERRRGI